MIVAYHVMADMDIWWSWEIWKPCVGYRYRRNRPPTCHANEIRPGTASYSWVNHEQRLWYAYVQTALTAVRNCNWKPKRQPFLDTCCVTWLAE